MTAIHLLYTLALWFLAGLVWHAESKLIACEAENRRLRREMKP